MEAIHLSRLGEMQIPGQEQKKLTEAIERETGQEKVELYHGNVENPR